MKILIINKFLYPNGGSETYIFEIGKQLKKMGHEVEYFGMEHERRCVGNSVNEYTRNMDFHSGSKLSKITYPLRTIYSKEARVKIRRVLEDFNPDVVHLNNFTFQITPSILYEIRKYEKEKGSKIKIVATIHDPQLVCPNHMLINGKTRKPCEKCLSGRFRHCVTGRCIHNSFMRSFIGATEGRYYRTKHAYKMIDTILCPSYFMQSKMETNPDICGRTIMLRNFITDKKSDKKKSDDRYVLYFGRYSSEKGIHTLVKAASELPDIKFIFAGNGPYENEVNKVENIKNNGFTTGQELSDLIAGAQFSLIASECFENCPFSVMESQLLGTPVIGADIGGIPELINKGTDGELFISGNVEDLKGKIQSLWNDEDTIKKYSSNCKKIVYDDINRYCEKLLKLYS